MVVSLVSSFNPKILKVQQGIYLNLKTWIPKSLVSLLDKHNLIGSQFIINFGFNLESQTLYNS